MDFQKLANRWVGQRARTYDADKQRVECRKARNENRVIASILRELGPDVHILDVPVGTGRFLELYQSFRQQVTGIDISRDMLAQARARSNSLDSEAAFQIADIRRIPYSDCQFDAIVCTRFFEWIDTRGFVIVLTELSRVSRRHIVMTIRYFLPPGRLELLKLAGAREYSRQLNRKLRQRLNRNRYTNVHSLHTIGREFEAAGLQVARVETTGRRRKDGTASAVYWLLKAHQA